MQTPPPAPSATDITTPTAFSKLLISHPVLLVLDENNQDATYMRDTIMNALPEVQYIIGSVVASDQTDKEAFLEILAEYSETKNVPVVFIRGECIGGLEELKRLAKSRYLVTKLEGALGR